MTEPNTTSIRPVSQDALLTVCLAGPSTVWWFLGHGAHYPANTTRSIKLGRTGKAKINYSRPTRPDTNDPAFTLRNSERTSTTLKSLLHGVVGLMRYTEYACYMVARKGVCSVSTPPKHGNGQWNRSWYIKAACRSATHHQPGQPTMKPLSLEWAWNLGRQPHANHHPKIQENQTNKCQREKRIFRSDASGRTGNYASRAKPNMWNLRANQNTLPCGGKLLQHYEQVLAHWKQRQPLSNSTANSCHV